MKHFRKSKRNFSFSILFPLAERKFRERDLKKIMNQKQQVLAQEKSKRIPCIAKQLIILTTIDIHLLNSNKNPPPLV